MIMSNLGNVLWNISLTYCLYTKITVDLNRIVSQENGKMTSPRLKNCTPSAHLQLNIKSKQ